MNENLIEEFFFNKELWFFFFLFILSPPVQVCSFFSPVDIVRINSKLTLNEIKLIRVLKGILPFEMGMYRDRVA